MASSSDNQCAFRLSGALGRKLASQEEIIEDDEIFVAELGAAFLCAETGVEGKLEHHANYVESWLRILKNDKRAVFTAAAAASKAAAFVLSSGGAGASVAAVA